MKWVKASDYAINSGSWHICKSLCKDRPIFTLWYGKDRLGDFDAAEKAKEAASER